MASRKPEAVEEPAGPWWKQVSPTVQDTLGVSVGDVVRWALVGSCRSSRCLP
jgi:hypothetical protein